MNDDKIKGCIEQNEASHEQQLMDIYNKTPKPPNSPCIFAVFGEKNDLLVAIDASGNLIFGDKYSPDDAAREFWNAVMTSNPTIDRFDALYKEINRLKIECYDLMRINRELRGND
jgi:hypothetical protein